MSDSDSESEDESNMKMPASTKDHEVIVVLDLANLEVVKTKKGEFQLLNSDDHVQIMKKNNKDPAKYRPDIIHQEVLAVLDSPLNKAGKVKLLVHTEKNVLIEIF